MSGGQSVVELGRALFRFVVYVNRNHPAVLQDSWPDADSVECQRLRHVSELKHGGQCFAGQSRTDCCEVYMRRRNIRKVVGYGVTRRCCELVRTALAGRYRRRTRVWSLIKAAPVGIGINRETQRRRIGNGRGGSKFVATVDPVRFFRCLLIRRSLATTRRQVVGRHQIGYCQQRKVDLLTISVLDRKCFNQSCQFLSVLKAKSIGVQEEIHIEHRHNDRIGILPKSFQHSFPAVTSNGIFRPVMEPRVIYRLASKVDENISVRTLL